MQSNDAQSKSMLPISIGTAIAIQSLMGYDKDGLPKREKSVLPQFDSLYINIRTLIRNFIGGQPSEMRDRLKPEDAYYGISADLKVINEVLVRMAGPDFSIMPYLCLFNDLEHRFPNAAWRQADTDKQKAAKKFEDAVIKMIEKPGVTDPSSRVLFYKTKMDRYVGVNKALEGKLPRQSLILTHMPIDLLSAPFFTKLVLIESHTGAFKSEKEWNTKLKGFKPDMQRLPFNTMTLQLFGDSGDMFLPRASTKMKNVIIALAKKYQWNPFTTTNRMISCARLDHEVILGADMRRLDTRF